MKFYSKLLGMIVATTLAGGCSPTVERVPKSASSKPRKVVVDDALVQFSLISALATGDYAEGAPLRQVLAGGDFGIGTFDRLEGEMIVLDGQMYQALADGAIRTANLEGTTPFAAVTFFDEDGRIENLSAASLEHLHERLDVALPRPNVPYALRISGKFNELTLRSVPARSPPFQPLVDVVKHQVTWQHRNVRGTLIGLRCPAWIGTLNVSGYHWHFLSDDRQVGGHVLGCEFGDGLLRFDECTSIVIHIPQSSEFDDFNAEDVKEQDIHQIERQRTPAERP